MRIIILAWFLTLSGLYAQITGKITDKNNIPLATVNIFTKNTYTGTTSNALGDYVLPLSQPGTYTIMYKYLGYKTETKTITIKDTAVIVDIVLETEEIALNEVVVSSQDNPANKIIRAAISKRKEHLSKLDSYTADFYSKGIIRINNLPEKFLGQEIEVSEGVLDSTRSGIIYLSETVSKIKYLKPEPLYENIIASKVSGDSNGFSFNSASDVNFSLYNNTIEINNPLISPIADYAFNYYRYKLEGVFYDDYGHLINKIAVLPKRENDAVFKGYIYIVEDQWSIFGVELDVKGNQIDIIAADLITITQHHNYNQDTNTWVIFSQRINFEYDFLGFKGDGSFVAGFTNYNLTPNLKRSDFSREILAFENDANTKTEGYWDSVRNIPLTQEEILDYQRKDSIQTVQESKTYLDSVDIEKNKFKLSALITGYSHDNSYEKKSITISSPLQGFNFNTVQGFNSNLNLNFLKKIDDYRNYYNVYSELNYSFKTKRLRPIFGVNYKFNNIDDATLRLNFGNSVEQFNSQNPISKLVNSASSLFFMDNYVKLYEKRFIETQFSKELFNGLRMSFFGSYEQRLALFNSTDYSWDDNSSKRYTSNNPLQPLAFRSSAFDNHHILRFGVRGQINIDQKYTSYPNSKYNLPNNDYPTLRFSYIQGIGATNKAYNFQHLNLGLAQSIGFENKGRLRYNISGGTFFKNHTAAFMDYKHFNGNQTHINLGGNYMNSFKNLEYYRLSTNTTYGEYHIEHDFKGYVLGQLPLIKALNLNLIIGSHGVIGKHQKTYQEYSLGIDNIGWGKYRFLRVDYTQSYHGGKLGNALLFGISL